jgi:hypothetical protein
MKTYEKCLACGTVLIEKPEKYTEEGKKDQEEFKYTIQDEYWEHVHKEYADNLKKDPVDTERHINFRVQDATLISSREEVERQHKAWHERQKTKEKVDDDSTDPEDLDMDEKQKKAMKKKLKKIAKKAFEQA